VRLGSLARQDEDRAEAAEGSLKHASEAGSRNDRGPLLTSP